MEPAPRTTVDVRPDTSCKTIMNSLWLEFQVWRRKTHRGIYVGFTLSCGKCLEKILRRQKSRCVCPRSSGVASPWKRHWAASELSLYVIFNWEKSESQRGLVVPSE